MKIIGHRGAAGLAPENTIKAIQAGIKAGADAIEFDIRLTKDGVFVLSHDPDLTRLAGVHHKIKNLTLSDLEKVLLYSDEPIPSLSNALAAVGKATAVVEGKGTHWAQALAVYLRNLSTTKNISVISFNHHELSIFHDLMPDVRCFALESQNAFKTILTAHHLGIHGVDLKFWILNPFTYWFAKVYHLNVIIYTVNSPFLMRWFTLMYPRVGITTNYPDVLAKIKK